MTLHIRPPRDDEWRICRMLLPETFTCGGARGYLLALRDEAPHIVAAASFRPARDEATHLRLHVVPSFRRRGVGSQLVGYIARAGARAIGGTVDTAMEHGAEAFCERNGFQREETLTTVEAEIDDVLAHMRRLRGRIALPAGARFIPLSSAPVDQVARLHSQFVAHDGEPDSWRARLAQTPGMDRSTVMMIHDRVAGILLWELEGSTAVVRSRVVAPQHHGGFVNAMLLADALDVGFANGARRVRFSYNDSNRDTQKLAARFHARVTSVIARYTRRAPQSS